MFNFVRLSDGGKPRHAGPRSEVAVIASIARAVLGESGPIDWDSMLEHDTIRHAIAAIVPGYEKLKEIGRSKQEFHISGRLFRDAEFPTATGRASFASLPLPKLKGGDETFRLMTVRSEGQFNTVVYEEEDRYRGQERRDVVLMHEADMRRLGLKRDDRVAVRSEIGQLRGVLVRPFDIRAGNLLMYYPEANVLVPRSVDPHSKTPSFKSIPVTIEKEIRVSLQEPISIGGSFGSSNGLKIAHAADESPG
jgi:anaerobic selenocysteine-containing dehydrogenase